MLHSNLTKLQHLPLKGAKIKSKMKVFSEEVLLMISKLPDGGTFATNVEIARV